MWSCSGEDPFPGDPELAKWIEEFETKARTEANYDYSSITVHFMRDDTLLLVSFYYADPDAVSQVLRTYSDRGMKIYFIGDPSIAQRFGVSRKHVGDLDQGDFGSVRFGGHCYEACRAIGEHGHYTYGWSSPDSLGRSWRIPVRLAPRD